MRYVKFSGGNGYCGCDWEEFLAVDDDTTETDLTNTAQQLAYDYAEGYEHVAEGYDYEDGWDSDESEKEYYENVNYTWKWISKEEYERGLAD